MTNKIKENLQLTLTMQFADLESVYKFKKEMLNYKSKFGVKKNSDVIKKLIKLEQNSVYGKGDK